MKSRFVSSSVVSLFLAALLGWGSVCTAAPEIPGPVTFLVHSAETAKPLTGVTVHVGARMAVSDKSGKIIFDGIPAGSYPIRCKHPGYQTFDKTIELPNGQRAPQVVSLAPEVVSPVKMSLVEQNSGESVVTARLHMDPITVSAALNGSLTFCPDREGNVTTIPVPEGTYNLRIEAPGFEGVTEVFEHKAVDAPVVIKLKPAAQPGSCVVAVTSADGGALANAEVELWEVYPLTKIASGRTDAGGTVRFSNLRIGIINPAADDGSLPATHRAEAVVRVQAEGHASVLKSVRLADGARLSVELAANKTIEERESNDSRGTAQRLRLGQRAKFVIDKNSDQDWFAFDLDEPAHVTIAFDDAKLELWAVLHDAQGKQLGTIGKHSSKTAQGKWNLAAGHYTICVTEWGMNGSSPDPHVMTLSGETAADPLEPNDGSAGARTIRIGQHLRGLIFPVRDEDHFVMHLDRPGRLRLETANEAKIERWVAIFDRHGVNRAHLACHAGRGASAEWQFEPGDYRVVVTEWGNNGCSLDPYDFRFTMMVDDGVDDPVVRSRAAVSSVRQLAVPGRVHATINPIGDQDTYTISVPSRGVLRLYQTGPIQLWTSLVDGRGKELCATGSHTNRGAHTEYSFDQAATVYLKVTEWGNNNWSSFPYELHAWFDPAGEIERLQPNETMKTAVPIELGAMVRDNILPMKDQDWYQVVVDQPGYLRVWNDARPQLTVGLHSADAKRIAYMNTHWNRTNQVDWPVIPGTYYLQVSEWGNNGYCTWDYALKASLLRALPGEPADLKKSPPVQLKLAQARQCCIEHIGDVERYRISIPAKGDYVFHVGGPLQTTSTATDIRTGKEFFRFNAYGGRTTTHSFKTEGPMELRLIVTEWGNNGANMTPNWIMVAPAGANLAGSAVEWSVNPIRPTQVTFKTVDTPGVTSFPTTSLDINADGQSDATLIKDQPVTLEFPRQGLYRVGLHCEAGAVSAMGELWVQATGQPVRKGLRVLIATPGEGEMIDREMPVRITALSYEGKAISRVNLRVNGRSIGTDYTLPYEFSVPWEDFAGGRCAISAAAVDASGKEKAVTRNVVVSDYFNLLPADGAVITGNDITVSWDGGGFGPAGVRYRLKGEDEAETPWKTVVGQNARTRRVRISDLEAGKAYEFQPLGGGSEGPVRQVTRVKGLAFTESHYGGTIARDYDQKLPVAVRNHAEEPRVVRLRCDQPKDSKLLVAFVGDGEKGRPVELGPGEQRVFTLGFSAQDVIKESHTLPIYIQSEDGYSDQSQVEVRVKLPKVDLEWADVTPEGDDALGRVYELLNKGDTLTDLNVSAANESINIQPEVQHGLIKAGSRMRFDIYPKIYEGFTGCTDQLRATSINKTVSIDYEGRLKPGEQVFRLNMTAGLDPLTGEPNDVSDAIRAARRLVGQYLSAETVDWTTRTDPQDTDRNGRPDRWTVVDQLNQTQWFGRDTDGDGEVDFAQADVGLDGEIDHSSILEDGKWRSTNLLDAYLEMNFAVPKHRSKYQPHDLDLIVNGQVVGQMQQTIPEGNYRFGLKPAALKWGGRENDLEINSHFKNFAHYTISSDFQLKTRLLSTDTYMIGTSREDAIKRLYESDPGFSTNLSDFSISSEDLSISPESGLKKGSAVTISGTVRNLGSGGVERLQLGLFLAVPGTEGKELNRISVEAPGMMTTTDFEFVWPAAPGNHSLRVVADPANRLGEANRKNNAGIVNVSVPGDDAPPTLTVLEPADGFETETGAVNLVATGQDDTGVIGVDVAVDGGPMKPLHRSDKGFEGLARLQSGAHTLRFRITDSGGNQAEDTRRVTVKAEPPECRIVKPEPGAAIETSTTRVQVSASSIEQCGIRINNGPWFGLQETAGMWTGTVDLPFGRCDIDVVAIDKDGMRRNSSVTVDCTAQPEEKEEEEKEDRQQEDEQQQQADAETDQESAKQKADTAGDDKPAQAQDPRTPQNQQSGRPDAKQPKNAPPPQNAPNTTPGRQPTGTEGGQPNKQAPRGDGASGGSTSTGNGGQTKAGDNQDSDTPADDAEGSVDTPQVPDDKVFPVDIPEENDVVTPADEGGTVSRSRPTPTRSRPTSPGRSPTGFAYNRHRNDWYCPNRPKIKTKFKLPEWLTKEEFDKILKKGPNSPEFKALEAKLLAGYWYRNFGKKVKGQTMDKLLLKYKELLLKRCGRLEQADGKLPSFLQSLGFAAEDPPTDPRELEKWRNKMKELTEVYWLRLLATEDPATVIQGMRKRADALGKYDEASQMQAEAIIQEIQANQKITQDVLEALPYTGEALDLIAAATGESLSGEKLGGWERFFRAACAAGPAALEEAMKRSPRMQEALGQLVAATGEMGSNMKNGFLRRIGADVDKFDEMAEGVTKFLTKERRIFGKSADDVVDSAKAAYRQSAEGMEELRQLEKAKEASKQTVDELDDLVMKGGKAGDADMEDAILRIQKDKTAQSVMNGSDVPMEVRKKANETIKKIYSDVDAPTMQRIAKHDDVKKFAQQHGLDPDSIEVSVWNPTNKRGPLPGDPDYIDPDYVKFGRDRDVTYQITGKTADGRTVTLDVNHDISGPIYQDEFFKRCNGRPPANADEAKAFANQMDQMVTSKWHREAYNTGPDVHIDDWLNNDITPPVARPEDIRDTIVTKSNHWFSEAAKPGKTTIESSRDMAEGMRQATKQWDNFVAKRAALYGANVPPQLEKAMDIFKQVENGAVSPKQAEHMLDALGDLAGGGKLTPQKVVENMATYFEAVEKGPGKAFRSIKTAKLAESLEGVRNVSARTDMINNAYRSGHISGETFRKMREGSFTLPPNPTPQQTQQLKNWAIGAWNRRAISATEKKLIEEQTGPLDE